MGLRVVEEEGLWLAADSSSSRTDYSAGVTSVRGALCIDKIHTPEMRLCATGSVRLVS